MSIEEIQKALKTLDKSKRLIFCYDYFEDIYRKIKPETSGSAISKLLVPSSADSHRLKKIKDWLNGLPPDISTSSANLLAGQSTGDLQFDAVLEPKLLFGGSDHVWVVTDQAVYVYSGSSGEVHASTSTIHGRPLTEYFIEHGVLDQEDTLLLTLKPRKSLTENACLVALKFIRQKTEDTIEALWEEPYQAPGMHLSQPAINQQGEICLLQDNNGLTLVTLDRKNAKHKGEIRLNVSDLLIRDCDSFIFTEGRFYLSLKNNGVILRIDVTRNYAITTAQSISDGHRISPLATNGRYLFFGTSHDRRISEPCKIYALDLIDLKTIFWEIPLEPDTNRGNHRPITGQPLVVGNYLYITSHNYHIYAIDIRRGEIVGKDTLPNPDQYEPPLVRRLEVGPTKYQNQLAAISHHGVFCTWPLQTTVDIVFHYDLDSPPIVGHRNPIKLTIINRGPNTIYPQRLMLHSKDSRDLDTVDISGTQELTLLHANERRQLEIPIKPNTAGQGIQLIATLTYQQDNLKIDQKCIKTFPLFIRNSREEPFGFESWEQRLNQGQSIRYNLIALSALLGDALPDEALVTFCLEHYSDIVTDLRSTDREQEKQKRFITYLINIQKIEQVSNILKMQYFSSFDCYKADLKVESLITSITPPIHQPEIESKEELDPEPATDSDSPTSASSFKISADLYQTLRRLFIKIDYFETVEGVREVMASTPELEEYQAEVPRRDNQKRIVSAFLTRFKTRKLADHRLVLQIFIEALRDQYDDDDEFYDQLTQVLKQFPKISP